jgi:hypothetical protein
VRAIVVAAIVSALALTGAAPAPPAAVTATISLVRAYAQVTQPGPIYLTQERRSSPASDRALLRVAIDPPPVVLPRVTFTIAGDPSFVLTAVEPRVPVGTPPAPAGQVYVYAPKPGHAVVTAHVGAPYNADVSADVFAYQSVELSCSSPAEAIALAVDAHGNVLVPSAPADADVYLALTPAAETTFFCRGFTAFVDAGLAEPKIRFPLGATRAGVPGTEFRTVSAHDWKNTVTEISARDARGVWLIRSRSGATIKLVVHGPFAVAPPGGEFFDRVRPVAPTVRVVLHAPATTPHFQAAIVPDVTETRFVPIGARPGHPLLVGVPLRSGYFEHLFGGSLKATVTPALYATGAPVWSVEGPLDNRGVQDGKLTLAGTRPGVGRITATFTEPVHAAASLAAIVYRTLAIGCSSIANGYGVAFEDDGTIRFADTPQDADLFASFDASAFRCGDLVSAPGASTRPPPPFTPGEPESGADAAAGWYFPYGGVFFPNGDDPARAPPSGSPRGIAFDEVTAARWRNDRTSEQLARYRADVFPCTRSEGRIGYPIPDCTTMPDRVLLIRTRRGRYVKLLWIGDAPGAFVGLYEVSRPDGTFAR